MKRTKLFLIALILLTTFTFWRMLRPGIYTMQDFHFFRLVEFDKCVKDLQIPCRWAPDAGFGYGEPVFNFYGQGAYLPGELFHLLGLSFINSLKLSFIFSLLGSGIAMFFLAKSLWKSNWAALVSGVVYIFAPYRAVDVWVRGALPEALSFVLFPLILLKVHGFIEKEEKRELLWFSFLFFLLIITHNLSVLLFLPVFLVWTLYKLLDSKKISLALPIIGGLSLSILLASFYILPILFESKFVNLESTTGGYFDFRGHFASLYQMLFSRFWGYGASLFMEEGMSRSVGLAQWLVPLLALVVVLIKKRITSYKNLIVLLVLGWLALFMAHNKSTFIWLAIKPLAYVQFPWRFLGMAVFAFALASGAVNNLVKKRRWFLAVFIIFLTIILNVSFFREDIWQKVSDDELNSGKNWELQTSSSIGDFWPKYGGAIPRAFAPTNLPGVKLVERKSNRVVFRVSVNKDSLVTLPVTYFPGWASSYPINVGKEGLISVKVPKGEHIVNLEFKDTPVRTLGNTLSIFGAGVWALSWIRKNRNESNQTV